MTEPVTALDRAQSSGGDTGENKTEEPESAVTSAAAAGVSGGHEAGASSGRDRRPLW